MIKKVAISVPGKIHLSGEHSVVYGEPALIASIEKRIYVTVHIRDDKKIICHDKTNIKKRTWEYNEIKTFADYARNEWELFSRDTNIVHLQQIKKDFWSVPKIAIVESYHFLKKEPHIGFSIEWTSDLPMGIGMGSSAALSAALVTAIFMLENGAIDLDHINYVAHEVEKRIHGFPSGGDNTAVVYGGLLRYQKKKKQSDIKPLSFIRQLPECLVIHSGPVIESTGQMIDNVAKKYKKEKNKIQKLFTKIGTISDQMIPALEQSAYKTLQYLIKENERLLEAMGVVGKKAKKIISFIESCGGSAKVCGAGGIKKGSGIILAFYPNIALLADKLKKENISFFPISLAKEGIKYEVL